MELIQRPESSVVSRSFRMRLFSIVCSHVIVLIHCCTGKAPAITPESRTPLPNDETDYEYVADMLQWDVVSRLCRQRLGSLAVVSSSGENPNLTSYLQSLNISQPVWISTRAAPEISGMFDSVILEFLGRNERQSARLRHKFSDMAAVTVCTRLRFDPTCHGESTVFSYSIHSFINEFQLRANVTPKAPIGLALLVHGEHSTYQSAFANDASWHSLCVSWTGNGGEWAFSADGLEVGRGSRLYPSEHIGGDGFFIIGQGQNTFDGSFKSAEAFCGSITQLYIWDRALEAGEIRTMEKECKPITSSLLFRWSISGLEKDPSIQTHWESFQCREISQMPNNNTCITFDPTSGKWGWDHCEAQRGGVCQFHKDTLENFPKTQFFTQVLKDLHANSELEEFNSTSSTDTELIWLNSIARSVVRVIEASPDLITPSDLLYLTQTIELAAAAQANKTSASSGVIMSMATNYLNLASGLIDPMVASQWLDLKPLGVQLRPFMVLENIDKLLWAVAGTIYTERSSFTVSTKNIDVYMEPRRLSQMSCSCVYKPSTQTAHSSSQDEILIPETEVQRVYSLGHKDVMFIHAYYGNLQEMLSKTDFKATSAPFHRLATAIISASVRDVSRAENIPVSVQYTLSTAKMVEYSKFVTPVCMFWNVSMIASHTSHWSDKGCRVLHSGPDGTSCFCNHTTNFAILMNFRDIRWSLEEEIILTKLTFIGSGASLCALVVTLMLFTVLDIPKSDRTSIHKNLFISLTLAQVVLLCSGSAIHNTVACTLVAALLHLFFMAAFSWMLVEGLLLWSKVVTVNLSEDRHMKYYYLIGWGLPVLIVTITLASASGKYSADGHCWLSVQNGVIWGFSGPVLFIIMVNIMVLTRVVVITISTAKRRSLMLAANASPVEQVSEQIRAAVKAVLVLLPILGLTWLCGVLVPFSIIMAYIFILLNSLQGLFIFLIYGVYNTEIRNTVNRIKERRKAQNFSNCGSSRPSSSVHSSRPGSSPVPSTLGGLGADANQPGSLSIDSDSTSLSYSHDRHLSLPCVHGNLEDPTFHASGIHMTGQVHVPPMVCVAGSCSLHVPMDEDLISCHASSSSLQNHSLDPF
uniref:Adhesion G protein-coupled receptor D2 n=2 Tax=Pygocentrus nattereri TaxID=42514 RepID=A0A3B4DUZ1_PYGNA